MGYENSAKKNAGKAKDGTRLHQQIAAGRNPKQVQRNKGVTSSTIPNSKGNSK